MIDMVFEIYFEFELRLDMIVMEGAIRMCAWNERQG